MPRPKLLATILIFASLASAMNLHAGNEYFLYDDSGNLIANKQAEDASVFAVDSSNLVVYSKKATDSACRYFYDGSLRLQFEEHEGPSREYEYGYLDRVIKLREGKKSMSSSIMLRGSWWGNW